MDNRPVIFLDSGIGCLPYAHYFHSHNPGEKLICVADRKNFPYGQKTKEFIIEALLSLMKKLTALYNPKILVIACNAASVSALAALRENYPGLPIVGTVPAVKPAVMASKKRRVGVLGTARTIADPYIAELAAKHGPDCVILSEAAPSLVQFAENEWVNSSKAEIIAAVKPWTDKFINDGADAIVLACTHFLLLKEEFVIAGPGLLIFDSVEGIGRRVEFFLDSGNGKLRSENKKEQNMLLKITGEDDPEPHWEKKAARFGIVPEKL